MNDDLISRDAVIYYIKGHIHEIITESGKDMNAHTNRVLRALINGVETMPPVNPQPCEDLISRQSAIFLANDLIQDLPDDERITDMVMARNDGILEYQTQLSLLPPVNPQEPKTGHWVSGICDDCGYDWGKDAPIASVPNYCPNCGYRMVEPQESEE